MKVYSVVDGKIKDIEQVKDEVFSKKMLGDGVAIEPSSNKITSPCNGEVTVVYPSGHLIGLKMDNGEEILIHIGIDTVELEGKPFKVKVKVKDYVHVGDLLCKVNFNLIHKLGYISDVVIISVTSKVTKIVQSEIVNRDDIVFETIDGGSKK